MNYLTQIVKEYFEIESINFNISSMGLIDSKNENTITFVDDIKCIDEAISNDNINVIIINDDCYKQVVEKKKKKLIISKDPRYDFFFLQNQLAVHNFEKNKFKTEIHDSVKVHETSFVAEHNVRIGKNVIVEPNVTILENVEIGDDSYISAGTVIGAEGFEHKRTTKGILTVRHDGKVIIGKKVFIGSLNGISKGFSFRNTIIGDETKTSNLVHIAHCVHIGKRCLLPASCVISGSVTLEDDVWIGPNATISSQIHIGSHAFVTLGAVVTKDVKYEQHVSGNFAIDHIQFLKGLKANLKV